MGKGDFLGELEQLVLFSEVEQLALCGQRVAAALKRGFVSSEAVTISLADGAAAGQDVPRIVGQIRTIQRARA